MLRRLLTQADVYVSIFHDLLKIPNLFNIYKFMQITLLNAPVKTPFFYLIYLLLPPPNLVVFTCAYLKGWIN